jgi:hypothetical protein
MCRHKHGRAADVDEEYSATMASKRIVPLGYRAMTFKRSIGNNAAQRNSTNEGWAAGFTGALSRKLQ